MAVQPPPAARPSTMSTNKLTVAAAQGRGEPIAPRLFVETSDPTGVEGRHVVSAGDVVRGLGLRSDVATRVERMVAGVDNPTVGGRGRVAQSFLGRSQLAEFLRTQDVNSDIRQEIEKRALAFWRRPQPGGNMRHVIKSSANGERLQGAGRLYISDLTKAAGHKYMSRKPDGKGGWTYQYAVPAKGDARSNSEEKGHVAELKEGTALRGGDFNGIPYKRKIEKIEHDEKTGDTHFHITGFHGKDNKYTQHADGSMSHEGRKLVSSATADILRPASGYTNPKAKYITVERNADGSHEVKEHLTKLAANSHGKERRAGGADINMHSKEHAAQFGLDPRIHPTNEKADRERRMAANGPAKHTHVSLEAKADGSSEILSHPSEEAAQAHAKSRGASAAVLPIEVADKHKLKYERAPEKSSRANETPHPHEAARKAKLAEEAANAPVGISREHMRALTEEAHATGDKHLHLDVAAAHQGDKHAISRLEKRIAEKSAAAPAKADEASGVRARLATSPKEKKPRKQKMTAKGVDHPPDAGPGKINVRSGDSHAAVEAQKFGDNYAVHRRVDSHDTHDAFTGKKTSEGKGGFTVTHLPTGHALHHAETKLEAQRFAQHMHKNAPDHFSGAKFGQTDFKAFPTREKEFHAHIDSAREASVYKSMRFIITNLRK